MSYHKLALLVALILLCLHFAHAQQATGTIRGQVLDQASESPLSFASVSVMDTDPFIGTTTDDNGHFVLDNIPVGRYNILVSYLGFEPVTLNSVLVSTGRTTSLNIGLKESVVNLQEVVVRPKKEKEKPLNKMAVVSARQLSVEEANKYAGGFDDPARLAASFAGVASNLTSNGIVIRGNAAKGLLWRIEGVEVPSPNHFGDVAGGFGAGGITALSSQMLANSDFLTGAFPAEYGNALSGVFDLSLRTGNSHEYEHAIQAGFMGLDVSSEGPLKKGGRSSYLANYRYSTLGIVDIFIPGVELGIQYQDLAFKLNLPTNKAGVFSVWGLGLIDRSVAEAETDVAQWTYLQDRQNEDAKIEMGVVGITHKYFFSNNTYLRTNLSASANSLSYQVETVDEELTTFLTDDVNTKNWNLNFSTLLNHKFGARHTNRSGIIVQNKYYDVELNHTDDLSTPLQSISDDQGNSFLIQVYSQSTINLGEKWSVNPGVHFQYFLLNKQYSIEPRASLKWQVSNKQSLSLGYGQHSRLENIHFYLAKTPTPEGDVQLNKDLDFSKAHHFVLSYDQLLGPNTRLKVEPYYQLLYDIPVIPNTSFSFLNLEEDWFVNDAMENTGKGKNIGLEVTLERFLNQGWYYLVTASVFEATYQGGDGVWRDSRFNRNLVGNVLVGKEWTVGRKKQNLFNISGKFTYQGGDRIHPVDIDASLAAKDIVEDMSNPFGAQKPDNYLLHITLTYRKNKKKHSSLWSLQLLNVLGDKENYGFRYNYIENTIDPDEETVVIPNLSYKLEF